MRKPEEEARDVVARYVDALAELGKAQHAVEDLWEIVKREGRHDDAWARAFGIDMAEPGT